MSACLDQASPFPEVQAQAATYARHSTHISPHTLTISGLLARQVRDLCLGRVLSKCSQEVSQRFTGNRACPSLVVEGEGLADFGVL